MNEPRTLWSGSAWAKSVMSTETRTRVSKFLQFANQQITTSLCVFPQRHEPKLRHFCFCLFWSVQGRQYESAPLTASGRWCSGWSSPKQRNCVPSSCALESTLVVDGSIPSHYMSMLICDQCTQICSSQQHGAVSYFLPLWNLNHLPSRQLSVLCSHDKNTMRRTTQPWSSDRKHKLGRNANEVFSFGPRWHKCVLQQQYASGSIFRPRRSQKPGWLVVGPFDSRFFPCDIPLCMGEKRLKGQADLSRREARSFMLCFLTVLGPVGK